MKRNIYIIAFYAITTGLFAQNVGIGTDTPAAKLDVKSTSGFVSKFNGATPMYLGLYESDVYRGYLGSYAGAAEDMDFGTGAGNTTGMLHLTIQEVPKLTINAAGNVGIGITSPLARLDVVGAGTTSSTNNLILRNSAGDTLIRLRNDGRIGLNYNGPSYGRTFNLGGSGINFYASDGGAFGGAVFPTDTSLVVWSNSGSNNYVILQPTWGSVGIGTYYPQALLDVDGTVIIGTSGTLITNIIRTTVNVNVPSVPANSSVTQTFSVTNAASGSSVSISPASALSDGLILAYARVSAAGTVEVKFTNVTGSAINPAAMNYYITVIE